MINYKMASGNMEMQDRLKLFNFAKTLTLKVAQVVVQSRQGKKISNECNVIGPSDDGPPPSPTSLQGFNLSIPDVPEVNTDTTRVLNGEVIEALSKIVCIEILLHTSDGDVMVLELWTVRVAPGGDTSINSVSTIYYRMSIMLKSTLSISRITPAYKLSRLQSNDSYKISHKIYGGKPNLDLLGEKHKAIKVSELHTPIGAIHIDVVYRTKLTITPENRKPVEKNSLVTSEGIMIKSDHFPKETPRKANINKKEVDLFKPLSPGAFVDTVKIMELHKSLSQKLPPESPISWLLEAKTTEEMKLLALGEDAERGEEVEGAMAAPSGSAGRVASQAIDVPRARDADKYDNVTLQELPFAGDSPARELACFYRDCAVAARAWPALQAPAPAPEPEPERRRRRARLAAELRACEDAAPHFDGLLADMRREHRSKRTH